MIIPAKKTTTQKTHFGPGFVQKPSARFFPNKSFESILSLYAVVTSYIKVPSINFSQNLKSLILAPLWLHFTKKTSKQSFSKKKII